MSLIDVKTALILQILNNALCCLLMFFIWRQNRKKYQGVFFWFLSYVLMFSGFLLIFHRDTFPVFLTIFLANIAIMSGLACLYIGIERFVGARPIRLPLLIHAVIFFSVLYWSTYLVPDIALRNVNISASVAFYCFLISYLYFSQSNENFRTFGKYIVIEAAISFVVNCVRIVWNILYPDYNSFFTFGAVNTVILVLYNSLQTILAFTLLMMVVRRLVVELEHDFEEKQGIIDELNRSKEKFAAAFDTSPNAIIISRIADGTILDVNQTFVKKTGYSFEEAISSSTAALGLWYNDFDRASIIATLSRGESITSREYRFRTKDNHIHIGLFSAHIVRIGQDSCTLSTIQDITDRKLMEDSLKRNQQFLSGLIEYSEALICVKYLDGEYKLVNSKWETVTGITRADALGKTDIELFPGETGMRFREHDLEVISRDGVTETEESFESSSGLFVFLSVKFPLHDDSGEIQSICNIMTDITDRKHDEEIIKHMATHDLLTDLPSLSLARDRLSMAMAYVRRYGKMAGVMFIDLDGFKHINDTHGHDAGDLVLRKIAQSLQSCIRQTDTAARIGGDEFLLILTEVSSPEDASGVARKLLALLSEPISFDGWHANVGASIGISLYPADGKDTDALIKAADDAMYRVKRNGKNSFAFAGSPDNTPDGSPKTK
jgi:diguanylate cyclase (GGDEF)-like protein/PAS domain S-box-containing protein